ncbi:MAG TPA: hypothetical protein VK392_01965 [Thermoanaerobaculia bacterium]|jgi:hypothetical protein|nr:hypothetical protein [Thermoanaerobaculia bacterium]
MLSFVHEHSLSLAAIAILATWTILYALSDPDTRWGEFFGNAVADWSGTLFLVLGTKLLYERGSVESRRAPRHFQNRTIDLLYHHSLTIFLVVTGAIWLFLFHHEKPGSKWGQVYGNILSEWLQMLGIVFLTKRLLERGSKESH